MMNHTAPLLITVGGYYAKTHEMGVENVIPFEFPLGIWGPVTRR